MYVCKYLREETHQYKFRHEKHFQTKHFSKSVEILNKTIINKHS